MHNVSYISVRVKGGYKQNSRRALPIFVCVSEDQQAPMTIYRNAGQNCMVAQLYGERLETHYTAWRDNCYDKQIGENNTGIQIYSSQTVLPCDRRD